jgi:hypothetical protein
MRKTTMNDKTLNAARQLSQQKRPSMTSALDGETAANAVPARNRIPLTARSRSKVLRVAPPIDDGFRPFRIF